MSRFAILAFAVAMMVIPTVFPPQYYVYPSGEKALITWDKGTDGNSMETSLTYVTPDKNAALLAYRPDYQGRPVTGGGYAGLDSSSALYKQFRFNTTTDYGVLARPLVAVTNDLRGKYKYLVQDPRVGPALLYLTDKPGQEAEKYEVRITQISGDMFTFTTPVNRPLRPEDCGSPILQQFDGKWCFVGAVHDLPDVGVAGPVMYRELAGAGK